MSKNIQLTIPKPCHENWDAMSDVQKGKFCGSCQKQVVDFTNMNDRQLAEFFKKPSTGSVCGRFMTDQLEREIEIPKKRIPWLKYFFTMALPAFFISKAAAQKPKTMGVIAKPRMNDTTKTVTVPIKRMLGEVAPLDIKAIAKDTSVVPEIKNSSSNILKIGKVNYTQNLQAQSYRANKNEVSAGSQNRTISGIVSNQDGEPVPDASVIVKRSTKGVVAKQDGGYRIVAKTGDTLVILAIGYAKKEIPVSSANFMAIQLEPRTMGEIVITGYTSCTKKRNIIMGAISTVKSEEIRKAPEKNKDSGKVETSLKVYPNPVDINSEVNVQISNLQEGYYTYLFTSISGQTIRQQEIWIDATAKVLNLDISTVAAGPYFLALINKKTGKKLTEKIIIQ